MERKKNCHTILMADDDPDDRLIAGQAFLEIGCGGNLLFVENGEELVNYLHRSGAYSDPALFPLPGLILLDLNMPKKDGLQVLREIKTVVDFNNIPVVIWTTSKELRIKVQCEEAGADSLATKPGSYTELIDTLRDLISRYCL